MYMESGALYTRHFLKGPRKSFIQLMRSGLVSTPCPKCSSLCCGCFVRRGYLFPRARTGVGSTQEACRGLTWAFLTLLEPKMEVEPSNLKPPGTGSKWQVSHPYNQTNWCGKVLPFFDKMLFAFSQHLMWPLQIWLKDKYHALGAFPNVKPIRLSWVSLF